MKKLLFVLMIVFMLSCSKDSTIIVEAPKVQERVMVVESVVLSTYPDFVVRYKVKRSEVDAYATITLTNCIQYKVYDYILYSF